LLPPQIEAAEIRRGYPGHKSTDKRGNKDQDDANRERFGKEMQHPKERFQREAARAAAARGGKTEAQPGPNVMDAVREFKERMDARRGTDTTPNNRTEGDGRGIK
jgi:hypothetical protein